jgi:hypothetical protein
MNVITIAELSPTEAHVILVNPPRIPKFKNISHGFDFRAHENALPEY